MTNELSLEQRAERREDCTESWLLALQVEELRDALLQSPCNCLYRPVSGKREREIVSCRRCEALAKTEVL